LKTFEEFYLKKDFEKALGILENNREVLDIGLWHYNMGTIYAELGNFPLARYHILSAKAEGLNTPELLQNKSLVEEKLEVTRLEKPLNFSDYMIKGSLVMSDGVFTTISLLFFVMGLFLIRRSKNLKSIIIFLVLVLIPILLNGWVSSWPLKLVVEHKAIYEGPSRIFNVRGDIPAGVLIISSPKGEWEEVIYPSRFAGWLKTGGLKELR
jgi:hypothetical protein